MIEGQQSSTTTAGTTRSTAGPIPGGTQQINTLTPSLIPNPTSGSSITTGPIPSATKRSGASQSTADYIRGAYLLTSVMKIAWLTVSVVFMGPL